jgi:hypothetical protein
MTNNAYAKNNGDGLLCSILWYGITAVSGLACSYGKIFIPPTYDLGKFKRDLGKRASSLSHMNTMQNFIGK